MRRVLVAASLAALSSWALAQDRISADAPGWTGASKPEGVILARQALMVEMERLMQPIDAFTAGEPADTEDLRSAAESIAQMLLAFPHLFPPTTNRYDAGAEAPATLALPAIWDEFETFYGLAQAASTVAAAMTAMTAITEEKKLAGGARNLRAACDACHARFLRPYERSTVTQEDLEFDFDALFGDDADAAASPPTQ